MADVCPYIGFRNDRDSHYNEPSDAHQCYSPTRPGEIDLDYQESFCFSSNYPNCSRFVPLSRLEKPTGALREAERTAAPATIEQVPKSEAKPPAGRPRSGRGLGITTLWLLALVLAVAAVYLAVTTLLPKNQTTVIALITPTSFPLATLTPTPQPTDTAAATLTPTALLPPTLAPLAAPTPPNGGVELTLSPDTSSTGWAASNELTPHWGDRDLQVGSFQGQTYTSVLQFTLGNTLPPGSKILFAALELTGRNAAHLGKTGEWSLELLDIRGTGDWALASATDLENAPALASIGSPLTVTELAAGNTNRFPFDESQLKLLEQELDFGRFTFRLKGPTENNDNLFSWDAGTGAGSALTAPTLYLVAVPAPFTVIANTPTAENVLTAAAYSIGATAFVGQYGTPTPFGPGVITATPGAGLVLVTLAPSPASVATDLALSAYATAVAITTGTYTPTPDNVVIITPTDTPLFLSTEQLSLAPTPTPTAMPIDYLATPIPEYLKGKILALTDRFGATTPIVLNPQGQLLNVLSGQGYYLSAASHEAFSPDMTKVAFVRPGPKGNYQIWIYDYTWSTWTQATNVDGFGAYDPAWSPDGSKILFTYTPPGHLDEIWDYELDTRQVHRIISSAGQYTKHPSWSPDGSHFIFWSDRIGGRKQIFIADADGGNITQLFDDPFNNWDPIWVK